MNDTTLTVTGNLTADPELRYTQGGAVVANFTVASTPRRFDKATGGWVDGEALFMRCTVWNQAAERMAESLTRGTRVIVTGRLRQRSWETSEGERRTSLELDVEDVGASLKFTGVAVLKPTRTTTTTNTDDGASDEAPF